MNFNFELILFYATVICGIIAMLDIFWLAPRRKAQSIKQGGVTKMPMIIDYARSFFPILLIVFLLRSFLYEPFRIPSGSLEPTLLVGDFIITNKFDYGIRLPVAHKKILSISDPKRGDIIVFRWPPNPSLNFIKRVIGVPGDHISYVNKELMVNGVKVPQTSLGVANVHDDEGDWQAFEKVEDLLGVKHHIYLRSEQGGTDYKDIVVPDGMYFVMGDNRDNSQDSRYWGFVPDRNIVGKAVLTWMSWEGPTNGSSFSDIMSLIGHGHLIDAVSATYDDLGRVRLGRLFKSVN